MFEWFKRRRSEARTDRFIQQVPKLLSRYAELIAKYPTAYMDESWLPVSKTAMKQALKIAWMLAQDDQAREHVRISWTLLCMFQNGVGNQPIEMTASDLAAEDTAKMNRFIEFAKRAEAEMIADKEELEEFIRKQTR